MQDGITTQAGEGMLVVNSSYMVHSYATPESSRIIVCTVPISAVPALRSHLSRRRFAQSIVDARPMPECHRILTMMADPANEDNTVFMHALAEALLAFLIEKIGLKDNTADDEADLTKRILIHLQEHAAEPLNVSQVAAHFGYSAGRFSHIFNERIGCSFTRYVNNLRCYNARRMLAEEDLPLIDVATACGFSSMRTFHRVYKTFTGETPRAGSAR
jgi:AraC-like DNA-binding protein